MSTIIRQTERDLYDNWKYRPNFHFDRDAVCSVPRATVHAATRGALESNAKLIAVFTESGFTARYLAGERLPVPTIAFTPNQQTVQRLAAAFGMQPRLVKGTRTSHAMTVQGEKIILDEGLAKKGDRIVMIFGSSRSPGFTNIVNIRILGEKDEDQAPASRRPPPPAT